MFSLCVSGCQSLSFHTLHICFFFICCTYFVCDIVPSSESKDFTEKPWLNKSLCDFRRVAAIIFERTVAVAVIGYSLNDISEASCTFWQISDSIHTSKNSHIYAICYPEWHQVVLFFPRRMKDSNTTKNESWLHQNVQLKKPE